MRAYVLWQVIGLLRSLPHTAWCSWEGRVSPSSILRFPAEVWQLHNSLFQMQLTLRMLLVMQGLPRAVKSSPQWHSEMQVHMALAIVTQALGKQWQWQKITCTRLKFPFLIDGLLNTGQLLHEFSGDVPNSPMTQGFLTGLSNDSWKLSFFPVWSFVMITLKGLKVQWCITIVQSQKLVEKLKLQS